MATFSSPFRQLAIRLACLFLVALPYHAFAQSDCGAYAGIMSVDVGPVCLQQGEALLTGTPSDDAVVPPGFTSTYLLTRTNGLIIEQMGPSPNFLVNSVDIWRLHRLVFDPATLDLGGVQMGTSSAYDVQAMITQGGGEACGSLSMTQAWVKTMECEEPCNAKAMGMKMDTTTVCLENGEATLTAVPFGGTMIPPGFEERFILTRTNGLIIEQISSSPTFTVAGVDIWRIHNIVYDPATLDLGLILYGTTTMYDLEALLLQGGGTICASLDMSGAPVKTGECSTTCTAQAGLSSADQADLCLSEGSALLSATPDGSAIVPPGYTTAYLLTQGTGVFTVLEVGPAPQFTVETAGTFHIHTLVYDPATFDIASIEIGVTTIMGLDALLVQGGGGICASLDPVGAFFQVVDCAPDCLVDAGTMTSEDDDVCLLDGMATLAAGSAGDTLVPPGFVLGYLISMDPGPLLIGFGNSPLFTVTDTGHFRIHAFAYDPATFDPTTVLNDTTTVYDLNNMLVQGGGSLCASLDVLGTSFSVVICPPPCNAGTDSTITVCLDDPAFAMIEYLGGTPCPGGSWTTPANPLVSGIFNPASDVAGTYTYTVTDINGAVHSTFLTINVLECPDLDLTATMNKTPVDGGPANGTTDISCPPDLIKRNKLHIWPNPSVGLVHVELPFNLDATTKVELTDASGRAVHAAWNRAGTELVLDASNLSSGLWTVRIVDGQTVHWGRFTR